MIDYDYRNRCAATLLSDPHNWW